MGLKDPQKRREYDRTKNKVRRQNPEYRDMMNERARSWGGTPAGKANKRAYARTDEAKAAKREYSKTISAKSRSRPNGHDLYVIECKRFPGEYKVGRAADPHFRAVQLSAGMPCYFKVSKVYVGQGIYEKTIHDALTSFRVNEEKYSEWFRIPYDELIDKIEDILIVALF